MLAGVMVSGCTLPSSTESATIDPALTDRSILTGKPCDAPCWYGIIVGASTEEDMIDTVSALPFLDPESMSSQAADYYDWSASITAPGRMYYLKCRASGGGTCAAILAAEGVVKQVILRPNYILSFSDVVAELGDPESVRFTPLGFERQCQLVLQWSSKGIMIFGDVIHDARATECDRLHTSLLRGERIDPSTRATDVWYVLPQDVLGDTELDDSSYPLLFPWPGFLKGQ